MCLLTKSWLKAIHFFFAIMAKDSNKLCTTRCQLFRDEMVKHENALRIKWFVKNREKLLENLRDDKLVNGATEIRKKYGEDRLARKGEDFSQIKDEPLSVQRLAKPDGSINLDTMKPVDDSIREIIYESGVESFINRRNYLRERYKLKPENRFYYPDCTSWLNGWRFNDYPPISPTKLGRSSIIQATFYRRNASSLQRDPDYYRKQQTSDPKNFDELLMY